MQNSFMRWCEYWNLGQKVGRRTKAYLELQKMLAGDFTQEVNVPFSEAEALQWGNLGIPTKDYRDRYAELRAVVHLLQLWFQASIVTCWQ